MKEQQEDKDCQGAAELDPVQKAVGTPGEKKVRGQPHRGKVQGEALLFSGTGIRCPEIKSRGENGRTDIRLPAPGSERGGRTYIGGSGASRIYQPSSASRAQNRVRIRLPFMFRKLI